MDWRDANVEGIDFPPEAQAMIAAAAGNSTSDVGASNSSSEALSVNCPEGGGAVGAVLSAPSPRSRASNSPNMPILRDKAHLHQRHLTNQKQRADQAQAASALPSTSSTSSASAPVLAYNQHAGSMSPESGQESDGAVGADSPGVAARGQFFADSKQQQKKNRDRKAGGAAEEGLLSIYMPNGVEESAAGPSRPPLDKEQYRSPLAELNDILDSIQAPTDGFDVKFTRCEALHAHGYTKQAVRMAAELADQLIASPPDLMVSLYVDLLTSYYPVHSSYCHATQRSATQNSHRNAIEKSNFR